jgi:hypothetical protein
MSMSTTPEDSPKGPPGRSLSEPAQKPFDEPETPDGNGTASPPSFRRSLSSANFAPNGDLYDGLDEDWLASNTSLGELSVFDWLDSFSVLPETLDKLNQRFKLQSRGVSCRVEGANFSSVIG